jgi:hypothetical protein
MTNWLKRLLDEQNTELTKLTKVNPEIENTQNTELTKLTKVNPEIENTQNTELTKLTKVNTPQFRRWRLTIQQAKDWEDLSTILDMAQSAFEAKKLTRDQAEAIAILAAERGNVVPRDARPLSADALFVPKGAEGGASNPICHACGQSSWWDNAGRQTCQICHPKPQKQIDFTF